MAKYYHDQNAPERIYGAGRFTEDWFEITPNVTYNAVMAMSLESSDDSVVGKLRALAFALIANHSLVNSDGTPLKLTQDIFGKLPFELTQPLIMRVNAEDFLAQLSLQAKAEK